MIGRWGHGASTWHDGGGQWAAGTTGCYGSWSWGDWWDYKNEPATCLDFATDAWTKETAQPVGGSLWSRVAQ